MFSRIRLHENSKRNPEHIIGSDCYIAYEKIGKMEHNIAYMKKDIKELRSKPNGTIRNNTISHHTTTHSNSNIQVHTDHYIGNQLHILTIENSSLWPDSKATAPHSHLCYNKL